MISFAKAVVHTTTKWTMLLIALTVAATGLLQVVNLRPVFADDGGYPWAGATEVNLSDYDWGYSSCPSNDSNCFNLSEYLGSTNYGLADPWVYFLRNCTSYAAWKINQVFGVSNITGWGNATTWDTGVLPNHPQTYTVYAASGHTPQVGEIAQWDNVAGGLGHVAYVYAVNNGIASLDDYNEGSPVVNGNPTWGVFWSGGVTGSSPEGTPDHYIHIGNIAPPPPSAPLRIGALYKNGWANTKESSLSSGWHTEANCCATQLMQDGTLTGMVYNGQFLIKQGNLDGSWYVESSSGVVQASISDAVGTTPIRIGAVTTGGSFWVRDGMTGTWYNEYSSNVAAGYVSGNRIAVLLNDGTFLVKEGSPTAAWVTENGSVSQGIISGGSGGLIGVVIGGTLLVKQGDLGAGWVTENGAVANAQLSNTTTSTPPRIGIIYTDGTYQVKEGLSGGWVTENGNVSQAALSGNLIGVVFTDGTYQVKQGDLGAGWVTEDGNVTQGALWSPN